MIVTATGQDGATDTIRVTFAVTNVDDKGMVTLLEMHPRSGAAATSIPADPDRAASRAQPGRGPGPAPQTGPAQTSTGQRR